MSAFAYIDIEDVPAELRETSAQFQDEVIAETTLISFDGCPIAGEIRKHQQAHDGSDVTEIIYPFPRMPSLRNDLVAWFMSCGIHFRVVM